MKINLKSNPYIHLFLLNLIACVFSFQLHAKDTAEGITFYPTYMKFSGMSSKEIKLSILFIYSPKNPDLIECKFEEDIYNIQGSDKFLFQEVDISANGNYQFIFPTVGYRTNCEYNPSEVFFTIESKKTKSITAVNIINFKEKQSAEKDFKGLITYPELNSNTFYCDFKGSEVNLCNLAPTYFSNFESKRTVINFLDLSQNPQDK